MNLGFKEFVNKCNDNQFELITFFGSIDYIALDNTFFNNLNKITANSSKCFISKFHPFWTTFFDNDVSEQNDKSYFDDSREDIVEYGKDEKYSFIRYHYSIDYILNKFSAWGWSLKQYKEPKPDFQNAAFKYKDYSTDEVLVDRLNRIPMTLILEFERTGE